MSSQMMSKIAKEMKHEKTDDEKAQEEWRAMLDPENRHQKLSQLSAQSISNAAKILQELAFEDAMMDPGNRGMLQLAPEIRAALAKLEHLTDEELSKMTQANNTADDSTDRALDRALDSLNPGLAKRLNKACKHFMMRHYDGNVFKAAASLNRGVASRGGEVYVHASLQYFISDSPLNIHTHT